MIKDIKNVILFQIDKTSKTAKLHTQKEFDRLGLNITVDQWVLLKIIHEREPLSQKELAEFSLRDPASITRTLDILNKKDLAVRNPIPENRRQYNVQLTDHGREFVKEHMPLITKYRKQSIKGFSKEEANQLMEYLLRIQDNMS